jgi:DNA-directed RNA polymerase subunit RPC12/RpoP
MSSHDCIMCGSKNQRLVGRWYKYDNGEQFLEYVCAKCADLHAKLVNL